jgi:tRNA(Ile)-lysidine synthase
VTDLVAHVEATLAQRKLLARGQGLLVAVSGGVDSMVLLHVLHRLGEQHRWKIVVAHFNHQLRGRASDADEKLVRTTAAKLGLKFVSDCAPVKTIARHEKESIEMAARRLRHDFLAHTATKNKCRDIALAHHADDQVELFFLRLLRGAGSEGLAGMKWSNPSPANKSIQLVRPLLDLPKSKLARFARVAKIPFREDATNRSPDFLRNRIRHRLLPLLRRDLQPALDKTVLRVMETLGAEAQFVSESLPRFQELKSRSFTLWPVALQRRLLQQQLFELAIATDFELIESLRRHVAKPVMFAPDQTVARDKHGRLQISTRVGASFHAREQHVKLDGKSGNLSFANLNFHWELVALKQDKQLGKATCLERFDAEKVGKSIILRHWRPGDRFQPSGMARAVKLQDWFVNRKVPRARRHELVVATSEAGEIFWVEGERITENFKLTPTTRRSFRWRWGR